MAAARASSGLRRAAGERGGGRRAGGRGTGRVGGGAGRAAATAEVWIVQPGRARVMPEVGGLLVSPDRSAWVRFPGGRAKEPAEVMWEEVKELPAFLPYGLGRAFAVRGPAPSAVGVRLAREELPGDSVSWQLAALFRYSETAGRWERMETARGWEGDDLVLTAQVGEAGLFAVALSTQSTTGNYEQPWQPTVRDYQVDLFTGAATWKVPIDVPPGATGRPRRQACAITAGWWTSCAGRRTRRVRGWGWGGI